LIKKESSNYDKATIALLIINVAKKESTFFSTNTNAQNHDLIMFIILQRTAINHIFSKAGAMEISGKP
jgi:hypothetical protein